MRHSRNDHVFIDLTHAVSAAPDADHVWGLVRDHLRDLGVSGMCYGMMPVPSEAAIVGHTQAAFVRHDYPQEWESAIGAVAGLDNDLTVDLLLEGVPQIDWHRFPDFESRNDAQERQRKVELDLGFTVGTTLLLNGGATGIGMSGMGLWMRDLPETGYQTYWQEYGPRLRVYAHALETGLTRFSDNGLVALSPRERDCLTYLAIGLRPDEIAFRLRISPKTLEKHITSAKVKLRARTRDNAVVKALILGAITP